MIISGNLFKLRAPAAKVIPHPGAQGLLAFQYGGCKREDPGTQQKSRDLFVHGEWKFIQNGGQNKVARIWVRELETEGKKIKWRQR